MKASEVKGTITLADGSTREFRIGTDGGWQQWGGTHDQLGASVGVVEAMVRGLFEDELLLSEEDVTCRECGASIEPDENGLCPWHASVAEGEAIEEHTGEPVQWRR